MLKWDEFVGVLKHFGYTLLKGDGSRRILEIAPTNRVIGEMTAEEFDEIKNSLVVIRDEISELKRSTSSIQQDCSQLAGLLYKDANKDANNDANNDYDKIADLLYRAILNRSIDKSGLQTCRKAFADQGLYQGIYFAARGLSTCSEFGNRFKTRYFLSQLVNKILVPIIKNYVVPETNVSDEIIILQTSDPERYVPILEASSRYNERYASTHGLVYEKFVGIKKGFHPHHAMFNKIYLLKQLLDRGFIGWVLYIDADAVIVSPKFDLKSYFMEYRKNQKYLVFHLVADINEYWNINDGVFAADLGCSFVQGLVKTWYEFYESTFSDNDFKAAKQWDDICNDQDSLQVLLKCLGADTVNKYCQLDKFLQDNLTKQIIRKNSGSVSDSEEILDRAKRIEEIGKSIYGF